MPVRGSVVDFRFSFSLQVILDEPTTGLDPVSKHAVWDSIRRLKQDRVVLLTTHSMEVCESPALGRVLDIRYTFVGSRCTGRSNWHYG